MRENRSRVPWEHIVGVLLTGGFSLWVIATPQYVLGVLPHVPLVPIMLAVVFGFLITLVYRSVVAGVSLYTDWFIGFVYSSLVWGSFIYAWVVLSMYGYPTWPSALVALIAPTLLLISSYSHQRDSSTSLGPFFTEIPHFGRFFSVIKIMTSLFFGFGSVILAVFLYTKVNDLSFGSVFLSELGLILMLGAAITGGLFGSMRRTLRG